MSLEVKISKMLERIGSLRDFEEIEGIGKEKVHLLGIGKAASSDIEAFRAKYPKFNYGKILSITKEGHSVGNDFEEFESTHPYMSEASTKAYQKVEEAFKSIKNEDIFITLISGGGSALVESPVEGLELQDLADLNRELLLNSVDILTVNTIRQAFSLAKNGGLLKLIPAKRIVNLISSDLPTDGLQLVAGAPTWNIEQNVQNIRESIEKLVENQTLKEKLLGQDLSLIEKDKKEVFDQKEIVNKITSNYELLAKEVEKAFEMEKTPALFSGNDEELIRKFIENFNRETIGFVGEAVLKLPKDLGEGGRCSHFLLRMAFEVFERNSLNLDEDELNKIKIIAIATDGTDGPTEYAGGFINYKTYFESKVDVIDCIQSFDSYRYLKSNQTALKLGNTGINLMDIYLIQYR